MIEVTEVVITLAPSSSHQLFHDIFVELFEKNNSIGIYELLIKLIQLINFDFTIVNVIVFLNSKDYLQKLW